MSAKRIGLVDSTGREWVTNWSEKITSDAEEQVLDSFEDFSELTTLALEVDGIKRYFNPAHVIAAWVEERP